VTVRPVGREAGTTVWSEMSGPLHPRGVPRALSSSRNPLVAPLAQAAERVKADRRPAMPDNPFVQLERTWADLIEHTMDLGRDLRDTWYEACFYSMWGTPWMRWFGRSHQLKRTLKNEAELRALTEV